MKRTPLLSGLCISMLIVLFSGNMAATVRSTHMLTTLTPFGGGSGRIAYIENSEKALFLLDLKTNQTRQLTDERVADIQAPLWSPNGQYIAFTAAESGSDREALYYFDIAANKLNRITYLEFSDSIYGSTRGEFAWSPDSNRIVFATSDSKGGVAVYVADIPTSKQYRLVDSAQSPTWSPDGRTIAFIGKGIEFVNPNGSNVRSFHKELAHHHLTYSPNGKYLAVAFIPEGGLDALLIYGVDGKEEFSPTDISIYYAHEIAWSPDSLQIVAHSDNGIVVTDLTGTHRQKLATYSPCWASDTIAWTPDGKHIAFIACDSNNQHSDLFVIDPDGSNLHRLSDDGHDKQDFDWSP